MLDLPPAPDLWVPHRPAIIRPAKEYLTPAAERGMRFGTFPQPVFSPVLGGVTPSYSFRGFTANMADTSTYTFSSHDIGTASATRHVVVCVHGFQGSGRTLGVTVGGVTATEVIFLDNGVDLYAGIYIAAVPTGTTADIVCTWSTGMIGCAVGVYAAYDLNSATEVDTDTSLASPGAMNITTQDDGIAFACANKRLGTSMAWSDVTEDYDEVPSNPGQNNINFSGASVLTDGSTIDPTVTYTDGGSDAAVCTSFR